MLHSSYAANTSCGMLVEHKSRAQASDHLPNLIPRADG